MRTSKFLLAAILMVIFSASARPQVSGAKALSQGSALPLQNASGQPRKPASVTAPVPAQARLLSVRISAEEASSRVVLNTTAFVRYSVGRLANPDRLYVHLLEATIDPQLKTPQIAGQDPFVSGIRIGNYEDSVTRVVFDLKSPTNYQISELPGGAGVIIELTSEAERGGIGPNARAAAIQPEPGPSGNVPTEKQLLSAAISDPEMSVPPNAPNTQRTQVTTPVDIREGVGSSVPVAVTAATTSILSNSSRRPDPRRSDAPEKLDSSTGNAIHHTVNKRSVVTLGSLPPVSDLPLPALIAVSEERGRAALGKVDFPAATNEVPNATRKAQTTTDLLESYPSMANFSNH